MFDLLNQGWVGTLIGLLGLLVGVAGLILYMKSKIGPRPACQMRSIRLIGKEEQELPTDVRILFQNTDVPRLTLTKIWFWNCGTETIRGTHVVEDDPLRCSFDKDDRILAIHVAAVTRLVNKFSAGLRHDGSNEVILTFDFLDPADGARVEILHTSKRRYPEILGTVRGVPKGIKQLTTKSTSTQALNRTMSQISRHKNVFFGVVFVLGLVLLILSVLPDAWLLPFRDALKEHPSTGLKAFRFMMLVFGVFYTLISLSSLMPRRRKYPPALDSDMEKKTDAEPANPPYSEPTVRSPQG